MRTTRKRLPVATPQPKEEMETAKRKSDQPWTQDGSKDPLQAQEHCSEKIRSTGGRTSREPGEQLTLMTDNMQSRCEPTVPLLFKALSTTAAILPFLYVFVSIKLCYACLGVTCSLGNQGRPPTLNFSSFFVCLTI